MIFIIVLIMSMCLYVIIMINTLIIMVIRKGGLGKHIIYLTIPTHQSKKESTDTGTEKKTQFCAARIFSFPPCQCKGFLTSTGVLEFYVL